VKSIRLPKSPIKWAQINQQVPTKQGPGRLGIPSFLDGSAVRTAFSRDVLHPPLPFEIRILRFTKIGQLISNSLKYPKMFLGQGLPPFGRARKGAS
jgi:hypothetical protein